ncbi:uncharacterized protein [Antedon mediterranea]|uniref:uncharacterized protein n=1 Tax=Antedon mediterranea TaxID=105859 RepID=UPI003AF4C2C5
MDKVDTKVLDSMYHRINNLNQPCKEKPSFESTSCQQLFACDVTPEEDFTENDDFSNSLKRSQNILQSKQNDSGGESSSGDYLAPFSLNEIYFQLSPHGRPIGLVNSNNQQDHDIRGWSSCPTIHLHPTHQNAQDTSCKSATYRSTSSSYNDAKNSPRSHSAGSSSKKSRTSREGASSRRTSDEGFWNELPPPMPIQYLFKHYKYPRQYVIQYREKYTYKKLKERLSLTKNFVSSGGSIPKAHLVCIDARQGVRGVTLGSKSGCERIVESFEQVIHDKRGSKDPSQKWNLFGHLTDRCDPTLTVNNPSPTEIATFSKMSTVRRSSPSIPSNSNGRFGFRGTPEAHYPFQLNISVGSCTINKPTKKSSRGVITN